jgi:uncharacterized membrane protein
VPAPRLPGTTPHELNEPRSRRRGTGYDAEAVGRFSESIARTLGTGRYLGIQTGLVIVWIALNVSAGANGLWDKFPFELLNLAFSTQSAYAAPLILLAQNRQLDRDKGEHQRVREAKARAVAETEFLARELADLRLSLDAKLDRADFADGGEVTLALDRLRGVLGVPDEPEDP